MTDKFLYEDENLSLKQKDDWYTYAHMSRSDGKLVAILVFKKDGEGMVDQILGRYENTLPHKDGITLASITGGVDLGTEPIESALMELYEEGGYEAIPEDLIELGTCTPSKQEDTLCYLYAFDATDKDRREENIGDGSLGEEDAYCDWVSIEDAINCKCPLVGAMIIRGFVKEIL